MGEGGGGQRGAVSRRLEGAVNRGWGAKRKAGKSGRPLIIFGGQEEREGGRGGGGV